MNDALYTEAKKVKQFSRELALGGPPEVVQDLLAQVLAWVAAMRALIRDEREALVSRFGEAFAMFTGHPAGPGRRPKDEAPGRYWNYRLGAWAALLFETIVAGMLAAQIFALDTFAAASVGVMITLVTAAILKAVCSLAVARYDAHPQKALALLTLWLCVAFPLWLAALFGTLLVAQTVAEPTPGFEFFFVVSRTLLSLLSPMIAAILLTCAGLIGWSRPYAARYVFLERLELEVDALEKYCEQVERRLATPLDENDDVAAPQFHKRAAASVALAMLALAVVLPSGLSGAEPCGQVWVDYSGSPDAAQMARAQESVLELAANVERTGIDCWEILGFYADAYSARPFHTMQVPSPPKATECRPPERSECGLFRRCRDAAVEQAQTRCDEQHEQAQEAYRQTLNNELAEARKAMAEPPLEFPGKCTALRDLLERLAAQPAPPAAAVILTDGEETCEPQAALPLPPAEATAVLMVILNNASEKAAAGRHFRQIEGAWRQRAPWLHFVPPYAVGPAMLDYGSAAQDRHAVAEVNAKR